jgi:hypothetical protein
LCGYIDGIHLDEHPSRRFSVNICTLDWLITTGYFSAIDTYFYCDIWANYECVAVAVVDLHSPKSTFSILHMYIPVPPTPHDIVCLMWPAFFRRVHALIKLHDHRHTHLFPHGTVKALNHYPDSLCSTDDPWCALLVACWQACGLDAINSFTIMAQVG